MKKIEQFVARDGIKFESEIECLRHESFLLDKMIEAADDFLKFSSYREYKSVVKEAVLILKDGSTTQIGTMNFDLLESILSVVDNE